MLRNGSGTAVGKNFKRLKYEDIIYHFETHGLEIWYILLFLRNIQISRFYEHFILAKSVFAHIFVYVNRPFGVPKEYVNRPFQVPKEDANRL